MPAARFYSSTSGAMDLSVSVAAADTSIVVDSTTGLPGTTPFTLVIDPGTASEEIVDVTNVSGTTLTVTRGVDGSAGQAHSAGTGKVRHMATARDFREPQEHIAASVGAHGVGSGNSVVGTGTAQALTNKDLSSPTNAFPASLATDAELSAHASTTATHGVSGAVVGTNNTQTLTNKTISGASNTLSNIPDAAVPTMNSRVGAIESNLGSQTTFAATSASKDSKRVHWLAYTGTTDGSGYLTVSHGAGFQPGAVVVTSTSGVYDFVVDATSTTTFRVRVWSGSSVINTLVSFNAFLGE